MFANISVIQFKIRHVEFENYLDVSKRINGRILFQQTHHRTLPSVQSDRRSLRLRELSDRRILRLRELSDRRSLRLREQRGRRGRHLREKNDRRILLS